MKESRKKKVSTLNIVLYLTDRNIWCAEFELIRNAMYTDPNDQSVWMYHRWLVGSSKSCLLVIVHQLIMDNGKNAIGLPLKVK